MAKKSSKPTVRQRVRRVEVDTRTLAGPFKVTGSIGSGHLSGVSEMVYYDPTTNEFVLADGRVAFDAMPSKTVKVEKSARSQEREKRREEFVKVVNVLNVAEKKLREAIKDDDRSKAAAARREIVAAKEKRDEAAAALAPLLTSTDKISKVEVEAPKGRGVPPGGKKSELKVLMENNHKDGTVRFFFPGASDALEVTGEDDKCKADSCRFVSPVVRAALSQFTDPNANSRGERGFFEVSKWDFPAAMAAVANVPNVRLYGAPELDLAKEFKTLDEKAKRVDKATIVWGREPMVGKYADGKDAPFQEDGVRFLMSRDRAILADDMGLGKTSQAIVAANNAVPKEQQILVLCPAAVVLNWKDEVQVNAPGAPVVVLDTSEIRKEGVPSTRGTKVRFVICSYQGASSLQAKAEVAKYVMGNDWGLIILDEAHRLKKPGTLGHKFVEKLNTQRMWFLTGTPIANTVEDFYGLLKLGQHPAGKRLDLYQKSYIPTYVKAGRTTVAENREKLLALGRALTGFVLRRTKEEVLKSQLPRKVGGLASGNEAVIRMELPGRFFEALEAAEEKKMPRERLRHALAVAKVPGTWEVAERVLDGQSKVVLFSTYTDVLQALAQLCDEYTDPQGRHILHVTISGGGGGVVGKGVVVKLFQGKELDEGEEKWAKKNLGQWFLNLVRHVPTDEWNKADLAECRKRYGKDESKWPNKISVVLAQMVAASEGVTLTQADTLLFNDLDYMPSRHEQAEDRIYRISRPKSPFPEVFIGYILANDPTRIDDRIYESLGFKRDEIQDVYNEIGLNYKAADANLRERFEDSLRDARSARDKAFARRKASRKRANPSMGL